MKKINRKRFPSRYCYNDFLTCHALNYKGQGIVYFHNKPFYIDELLPGELAKIIVYHEEKKFGNGRAIKLKKTSPNRALPLGHWKFKYGGYNIPHMDEAFQDKWKTNTVQKIFGSTANQIIVGKRKYYRNKVVLHDGQFLPPGPYRGLKVEPDQFDLIKLDWTKYKNTIGNLIIRQLKTTIAGPPGANLYCFDELDNKKIRVNLNSFYQVNSEMALCAYQTIKQFIPTNARVLDMFSGIGTIAIYISDITRQVTAVEINHQSHDDAVYNIKLNNIKNITAVLANANQYLNHNHTNYDVIIFDPGRAGVADKTLKLVNDSDIELIIYLSCNIYTQKPNIDILTNYQVIFIQPFDFFPQTYHIENLVVLKHKS